MAGTVALVSFLTIAVLWALISGYQIYKVIRKYNRK